jgi:glycosyltransferase involved in cell wall biosynthesis
MTNLVTRNEQVNLVIDRDTPNQPLHLLLLANSIGIGGMEEHVELLARLLDRQQFEVFAVCPEDPHTEPLYRELIKVADHVAKITPDRRYGLFRQFIETIKFYRQIRSWQIKCMHMHSTTYRGELWAFLAARLAGVRKIYVTEHLAPDAHIMWVERWLRNIFSYLVDGVVCVSRKNYEARADYLYTPKDRTTICNNGVDIDDFQPIASEKLLELRQKHNLPLNAKIIGTVVRFEPEKGLEYFIEAAPAIKAACPDAYFLMVGDGSLRAELEAHVARLGLTECFRFTGFQSEPRPYLGLLDVFVLPVPVGSMSIGLLEAMAMKRAVVMTFGGEGEAVVDGVSGFCAEPRNPAAIAKAVITILDNPQLQKAFGEAARQHIETEFSAQRVAKQLGELYLHS